MKDADGIASAPDAGAEAGCNCGPDAVCLIDNGVTTCGARCTTSSQCKGYCCLALTEQTEAGAVFSGVGACTMDPDLYSSDGRCLCEQPMDCSGAGTCTSRGSYSVCQ